VSSAKTQVDQLRLELAQALQERESCEAQLAKSGEELIRQRAELIAAERIAEQKSCQLTEQETRLEILADLEAELRYRSEDCSRLEAELSLKAGRILELEAGLTEAEKRMVLLAEHEKATGQEFAEAKTALEAAVLRCEDLERELANSSLRQQLNNSSQQLLDDSRSEAMSTSTVSRAEELSRMKDIEDSFEDRYAKLKLVAIKLKKKVADQAKLIGELESSSGSVRAKEPEPSATSSQLKDKLTAVTNNFSRLQAGLEKTRLKKKPAQWVFLGFFGFSGFFSVFFLVFLYICPEEIVLRFF
jgi:chromosome segregation ATPase